MIRFRIQLARAAARDLDRLSSKARDQIVQDLQALEEEPIGRPPRMKRLRGFPFPLFRLRSGDYRVIYRVDEDLVTVMRIIERKDLERALKQLGLR
ncbi:MAG: type II toxin-antitoxin system RelE family toxin [bacterium]